MMEEDFYASIKFINGEEIFAKVIPCEEQEELNLLLSDPIIITEVKTRYGFAYKVEPWMKTTKEDMFIVKIDNILTMTETTDLEIISVHEKFVKQKKQDELEFGLNHFELTKEMGYVSNIEEAKKILEKIFKGK
jgi:hypothetical protein